MKREGHCTQPKERHDPPIYLMLSAVICMTMVIAVIISAVVTAGRPSRVEFIPPAFDADAIKGEPDISDEAGYREIYQEGMDFSARVCGEVRLINNDAIVYFTNPQGNDAWLKLRILDDKGNILGESGLIKPGEYVRSVSLTKITADGIEIKMRIMGYEPYTYNSIGSVSVKTKITYENG